MTTIVKNQPINVYICSTAIYLYSLHQGCWLWADKYLFVFYESLI